MTERQDPVAWSREQWIAHAPGGVDGELSRHVVDMLGDVGEHIGHGTAGDHTSSTGYGAPRNSIRSHAGLSTGGRLRLTSLTL
jgi:hypothetical protein